MSYYVKAIAELVAPHGDDLDNTKLERVSSGSLQTRNLCGTSAFRVKQVLHSTTSFYYTPKMSTRSSDSYNLHIKALRILSYHDETPSTSKSCLNPSDLLLWSPANNTMQASPHLNYQKCLLRLNHALKP